MIFNHFSIISHLIWYKLDLVEKYGFQYKLTIIKQIFLIKILMKTEMKETVNSLIMINIYLIKDTLKSFILFKRNHFYRYEEKITNYEEGSELLKFTQRNIKKI